MRNNSLHGAGIPTFSRTYYAGHEKAIEHVFKQNKRKYVRYSNKRKETIHGISTRVPSWEKKSKQTNVSYIYVSVNLSNQAIYKLSENVRQFVKWLFKLVNLFFYAWKTLKPGSLPPIKEHPAPGIFFLGLVDLSRNRLVPTAYQKKLGSSVLHG